MLLALFVSTALNARTDEKTPSVDNGITEAIYFNIPKGPAKESLDQLGKTINRPVFFMTDQIKGIVLNRVKGKMSLEEAIFSLVKDTRLSISVDEEMNILVAKVAPEALRSQSNVGKPIENNESNSNTTENMKINGSTIVKSFLSALTLGLLGNVGNAADIKGSVYDASNHMYLEGIEISIEDSDVRTFSRSGGEFYLTDLAPGSYTIKTIASGYQSVTKKVSITDANDTIDVKLLLNTSSEDADVIDLETYVVRGTTSATIKALNIERASADLRDVVASDAFGQFVDRNPAEALQRVPGVTVEDDQGEGNFVIIRGASPDLSNVQLDGIELATPQADGRKVNLNIITVDQLERIEVSKTWLPSQKGNTIGGTVNLVTRSALDRGKRFLSAEAAYTQYAISDDPSYRGYFTYGDTLDREDISFLGDMLLGFQFSTSYSEDNRGSETLGFSWNSDASYPFGGAPLYGYTLTNNKWRDFQIKRERLAISSKIELKINDDHLITFGVSYNRFDDDEVQRFFSRSANVGNDFNWDGDEFLTESNAVDLGYALSDQAVIDRLAAAPTSTTRRLIFQESIDLGQLVYDDELKQFSFGSWTGTFSRNFDNEITTDELLTYQIGGEHRLFDRWNLDWSAYKSKAERDSEALIFSFSGPGGIVNSVSGIELPKIDPTVFAEVSLNPELFTISEPSGSNQKSLFNEEFLISEDERTGFKVDVKKQYEWMGIRWTTQFGASFDSRDKSNSNFSEATQIGANAFDDDLYMDNRIHLSDDPFYGGDSDSFSDNFGSFFSFGPTLNIDGLRKFAANPATYGVTIAEDVDSSTASSQYFSKIVNSYSLTEDIAGLYWQQTANWGRWSVIFGARLEQTENTFSSRNILTRHPEGKFSFIRPSFWRFLGEDEFSTLVVAKRKYDHFLPALHVRRDIGDNSIVRASVTKTMARPQFDVLNAREVPSLVGNTGFSTVLRKPNFETIEPMESVNYDLSWEHYFEPVGVVSVSVFYKDLTGPIYNESRKSVGPNEETREYAYRYISRNAQTTGVDDPTLLNSSPWTFNQYTNAGDAYLQGFELAFSRSLNDLLPDVMDGFSIEANYAAFDSEVELLAEERTQPDPGNDETIEPDAYVSLFKQPDQTANMSLVWERGKFFARVSYNLRGSYLQSVSTSDSIIDLVRMGGKLSDYDRYLDDTERWDFTVRYNPTEQTQLFFEISNFTNETQTEYYGDLSRPASIRYTDAVYTFGVKAHF